MRQAHWGYVRAVSVIGLALAVSAAAIAGAQTAAMIGSPPTVLLVHSYRSTTMVGLEDAFRDRLEKAFGGPVDLQVEFLDLPDASVAPHARRLFDLLSEKYAGQKVDLVVVVGLEGLRFFVEKRATLFPTVPAVFTNIDRASVEKLGPLPNVTGAFLRIEGQRTMIAALDLQPEARRVVLVGGASPGDKENEVFARRLVQARRPGLETVSLAEMTLKEQLDRLSRLSPDSVVFFVSYRADSEGRSTVARDVLRLVTKASGAPVYGAGGGWLGLGIVGGDIIDNEALGERAADLAVRILRGEPVSSIAPTEEASSRLMFDWRELRRFGLSEARLPLDSVVLYRDKTLWSEHRGAIVGTVAVLFAQAVLIGALLVERRNRRQAEGRIRQGEERYRTLADFTYDWEYWARPDGGFEYVSPSCLRLTGHTADEFYARPSLLHDLVVEEERAAWLAHAEERRGGKGESHLEFHIRHANGRLLWIDHVCTPVTGDDGRLLGVRGSNRDVTERKRAEGELRQAFAEIQRLRDRLEADNTYLREQVEPAATFEGIIGRSNVLQYVLSKIQQVAPTSSTVLLQGETGVGKELVAHALHGLSPRASRPLIKLNCAALPASLVESELFGHEKGAFTGAIAQRKGRFEIADGSTLFLDEVGELPLELQAKLLRVIQDGELERVGGTQTLKTDVRLVAATNRRLDEEVKAGRFREDLWYRLNVFPITMPPLRQRPEDIPLLVAHFVEKHCRRLGRPPLQVSQGTLQDLQAHDWPGNVRELEAVVERAIISSSGLALRIAEKFGVEAPVAPGLSAAASPGAPAPNAVATNAVRTLIDIERDYIAGTLERTYWRLEGETGAAALLGMNPSTLRSRMRKLGIRRPGSRIPEDPPPHPA